MNYLSPADAWTADEIRRHLDEQVEEHSQLDYKQEPGRHEQLLKHVVGLANGRGGTLLLGVQEERDEKGRPTGIPKHIPGVAMSQPTRDQERIRYQNIIRDGVEPRLAGVTVDLVAGFPVGPVVVVAIQPSFRRPHRVRANGNFYIREGAQTVPMEIERLREMFVEGEELPKKVERLRTSRREALRFGEYLVIQTIPFSAFARPHQVDPRAAHPRSNGRSDLFRIAKHSSTYDARFCLEGLVVKSERAGLRVFRSGAQESYFIGLSEKQDGKRYFPWAWVEDVVLDTVRQHLALAEVLSLEAPFAVALDIVGAYGMVMPQVPGEPTLAATLISPPALVFESAHADLKAELRYAFDMIFQAAGRERSPSYDKNGKWIRKR